MKSITIYEITVQVDKLLGNVTRHPGEVWSEEYSNGYRQALEDVIQELELMTRYTIILDAKPWIQMHPDDNPSRVVLVAHLYPEVKEGIDFPKEYSTHTQVGKGEGSFLISGQYCQELKHAIENFHKRMT